MDLCEVVYSLENWQEDDCQRLWLQSLEIPEKAQKIKRKYITL